MLEFGLIRGDVILSVNTMYNRQEISNLTRVYRAISEHTIVLSSDHKPHKIPPIPPSTNSNFHLIQINFKQEPTPTINWKEQITEQERDFNFWLTL
ncbi:hypothetical protein HanIR_Chr09g0444411 [Helianthus annuus]|nr:hypothetical protein HanIR_Chr09g0444411 [Helianthus annuus]